MSKIPIVAILFVVAASFASSTALTIKMPIHCERANINAVRIDGCEEEPCTLKKGVVIPIEVDFFFETPKSTNEIDFFVYIAYWKIPGTHEYTSNIAEGRNCTSLNLQSCPAVSGGNYTLKSQIYVDPLLSFLTKKTGEVLTSWKLTVGNKFRTGKNFSQCFFSVQANITYE